VGSRPRNEGGRKHRIWQHWLQWRLREDTMGTGELGEARGTNREERRQRYKGVICLIQSSVGLPASPQKAPMQPNQVYLCCHSNLWESLCCTFLKL
jgi:hypothetical protein